MNTYEENRQKTVNETLAALSNQQAKADSIQLTAEYNLYYAQGAELSARQKLEKTEADKEYYRGVNEQGIFNDNQATKLLTSATIAQKEVATAVSNMSTAAANVQIASNVIALLASDMGAAFNIATASLYETDTYQQITDANNFIIEVANNAKAASLSSMESSGLVSEIISSAVQGEAVTTKSKIEALLKITATEFSQLAQQAVKDNAQVGQSYTVERLAAGQLEDAKRDVEAALGAYVDASTNLNLGLKVEVVSGTELTLTFNRFPEHLFNSTLTEGIKIPDPAPEYYVTFVPDAKKGMVDTGQVEQLFTQNMPFDLLPDQKLKDGVMISEYSFTRVHPGETHLVIKKEGSTDLYGKKIESGKQYVAFIFIVLSQRYKSYIANYSNQLSAPSQTFTPATALPCVQRVIPKAAKKKGAKYAPYGALVLELNSTDGIPDQLQLRCIFLKKSLAEKHYFYTGDIKPPEHIYFNLALAEQVAPANYVSAVKLDKVKDIDQITSDKEEVVVVKSDKDIVAVTADHEGIEVKFDKDVDVVVVKSETEIIKAKAGKVVVEVNAAKEVIVVKADNESDKEQYLALLPTDLTDNFGNPIEDGSEYHLFVLSVIDGDAQDRAPYTNTLTDWCDSLRLPLSKSECSVNTCATPIPCTTKKTEETKKISTGTSNSIASSTHETKRITGADQAASSDTPVSTDTGDRTSTGIDTSPTAPDSGATGRPTKKG